jgi:PAS domain S-box-containing protein
MDNNQTERPPSECEPGSIGFADIPPFLISKWQTSADLLAELIDIPAALVMKTEDGCMEVTITSNTPGNPYQAGDKEKWDGLYCETVIKSQKQLMVVNALKDADWDKNPDIKLGMIAYLGLPVNFPGGNPYGTLCVLDNRERLFTDREKRVLVHFRDSIEADLQLLEKQLHTERRQAEVQASEEHLKVTLRSIGDGVISCDLDARVTCLNGVAENLTGWANTEAVGRPLEEVFHIINAHTRKTADTPVTRALSEGIIVGLANHTVLVARDGTEYQIADSCAPIRDAAGTVSGAVLVFRDVTGEYQQRKALRESETLLAQAQEISHTGSWKLDLVTNQLTWSDEVYRIFGCQPQEFPATYETFLEFVHPDDRAAVDDAYSRSVREGNDGYDMEHRIVRRNTGEVRYLHERCVHERDAAGAIIQSTGMVQDITGFRRTEQEMHQIQAILQGAMNCSPAGIAIADAPDGRLRYVNDAGLLIRGGDRQSVINGVGVEQYVESWKLLDLAGRPLRTDEVPLARAIMYGEKNSREFIIRREEHEDRIVAANAAPVKDETGKITAGIVVFTDITERKRAEEIIAFSEEKFRLAFMTSPDSIAINRMSDGRYIEINEGFLRIMGYKREEVIGRTSTELNVWQQPEDRKRLVNGLQADGYVENLSARFCRADGTIRAGLMSARVIELRGEPCILSITRDITERKQVETYREMGRKILQILNEPGDLHETIQHILAALKEGTGADAVGLRLQEGEDFPYFVQDGFSRDFLQTENTLIERDQKGGVCRDKDGNVCLECTCGLVLSSRTDPANPLFTKGGSCWTNDSFPLLDLPSDQDPRQRPRNNCIHQGYASVALIPIRTRNRIVGLIQLNDKRKGRFSLETIEILEGIAAHIGSALTRRQAEEALREVNRQLERSAQQALELAEKAEAASVAKSQFLANMSHELRTPMNAVLGVVPLLQWTPLTDEQKQLVQIIEDGGKRLLGVINDVLDFSKIQAGKMSVVHDNLDLRSLLEDFAAMMSVQAHAKQLELICFVAPDVPTALRGDAGRLRQILSNLVGNAIKFTEKGEVAVRVTTGERRERRKKNQGNTSQNVVLLHFSVTDSGAGIPENKMDLLFQSFTQVDGSYTRQHGGTGLGLAISRELAQLMGGDITVSSVVGEGTEFVVSLPMEVRPGTTPAEALACPQSLHGVRILVVDDNATCRQTLGATLESWGLQVAVADGSAEAQTLLEQGHANETPFRLALFDATLPGEDAAELARKIRADARNSGLSLALMTSFGERGDARMFADAGFGAYLTKPLRHAELQRALTMLLSAEKTAPPITRHTLRDSHRKGRILLVEDNHANQLAAKLILQKLGLDVEIANNGREALEVLAATSCDLVLMDIQMPEMDGMEATRRIRAGEVSSRRAKGGATNEEQKTKNKEPARATRLPIIALTAHSLPEDREQFLAAGMDDCLIKPIDVEALIDVLDRWLKEDDGI